MAITTSNRMRSMLAQMGLVSRADGSAQLSQGATVALSGVYGPVEVRQSNELVDRMAVKVSLSRICGAGVESRAMECALTEIISSSVIVSLHPKCGLQVAVQMLGEDGGSLSCAINVCCLALMDSAVAMHSLFAAVQCAVIQDDPTSAAWTVIVDPDEKQCAQASSVTLFVFENRNGQLLAFNHLKGLMAKKHWESVHGAAVKASQAIFNFYRRVIKRKFSKEQPFLSGVAEST